MTHAHNGSRERQWKNDIRSLGDLDVPFTPSPECDIRAGNQCNDDYDLTPFS